MKAFAVFNWTTPFPSHGRSLFANMIPPGKEAELFSIYEISERGTSWLGPLAFGLVNQITGSLRPAIVSIILFFNAPPGWTVPKYMADLIAICIYVNMSIDAIISIFSFIQENENLRKKSISADTGWHFRDPPNLNVNQSMYTWPDECRLSPA